MPIYVYIVNSGLETRQQRRFDGSLRTARGRIGSRGNAGKLPNATRGIKSRQPVLLLAAFMLCRLQERQYLEAAARSEPTSSSD